MDVFISYAREDYEVVQKLVETLSVRGWSIWWDRSLLGGDRFVEVIERELTAARCVIVLWSKDSVGSPWVHDEASRAQNAGKLVPIRIEDVAPPLGFGSVHAESLFEWSETELAAIARAVERKLGVPAQANAVKLRPPRQRWQRHWPLGAGLAALGLLFAVWPSETSNQGAAEPAASLTTPSAAAHASAAQVVPAPSAANAALRCTRPGLVLRDGKCRLSPKALWRVRPKSATLALLPPDVKVCVRAHGRSRRGCSEAMAGPTEGAGRVDFKTGTWVQVATWELLPPRGLDLFLGPDGPVVYRRPLVGAGSPEEWLESGLLYQFEDGSMTLQIEYDGESEDARPWFDAPDVAAFKTEDGYVRARAIAEKIRALDERLPDCQLRSTETHNENGMGSSVDGYVCNGTLALVVRLTDLSPFLMSHEVYFDERGATLVHHYDWEMLDEPKRNERHTSFLEAGKLIWAAGEPEGDWQAQTVADLKLAQALSALFQPRRMPGGIW
jgi:hypothetical protein